VSALRLSRVKLRWRWTGSASRHALICSLLVVFVLLSSRIAVGQASSPIKTTIVFYADPQVEASIWPSLFDAFHAEVAREESDYPLPGNIEPVRASSLVKGQEFERVIAVHLIGRCDVVQQAYHPTQRGPLGWVLKVSGEIQPFIFVDCERLSQFLNPATLGMSEEQRSEAMARAISRIAIHEWIHIDAQTARHESHGVRQAELSVQDLVAGSRIRGGR
jgi:hypothetical protein